MSGSNNWAAELILVASPWSAAAFYPAGTCVLSAIDIPVWTTTTRPGSPNTGRTGFNTTLQSLEQWNGSAWQQYVGSGSLPALLVSPPPIGSTTPNSGAFTTLSASSTVSGSGFSTYLASPPAIGGTAPAAGSFTTLAASGAVSGSGFSTYLASPPAIGGTTPAAGAFTTLSSTGTFTPAQLAGIVGTTTNNNANAGSIGEFVSSSVAGTSVSLTNNVAANATSISLTAGDWDVSGNVQIIPSGVNLAAVEAWISTTSAAIPTAPNNGAQNLLSASAAFLGQVVLPTGTIRLTLAATTTVYLGALAGFSTGTCTAGGFIGARRRR